MLEYEKCGACSSPLPRTESAMVKKTSEASSEHSSIRRAEGQRFVDEMVKVSGRKSGSLDVRQLQDHRVMELLNKFVDGGARAYFDEGSRRVFWGIR